VLIDFDEVPPESSSRSYDSISVQSKGFDFFARSVNQNGGVGVDSDGVYATSSCFNIGPGNECGAYLSMTHTAGETFAILSIGNYEGWREGKTSDGSWADLSSPIGTGDWLDLRELQLSDVYYPEDSGGFIDTFVLIDDIRVNVVPIPAAVWLFASALFGLGALRRRNAC